MPGRRPRFAFHAKLEDTSIPILLPIDRSFEKAAAIDALVPSDKEFAGPKLIELLWPKDTESLPPVVAS